MREFLAHFFQEHFQLLTRLSRRKSGEGNSGAREQVKANHSMRTLNVETMKKSISSRINMYVVTLDACKQHEAEWAGIPKMVSAVNDLENRLNELNAIVSSHEVVTVGVGSTKTLKLKALYAALEEVHGAFRMLADELGDNTMRVNHTFSPTALRKMNTAKLQSHIARTADALIESGALLEPFGIDSSRLGSILQVIDECVIIISKPRIAIVERKSLTAGMSAKVDAIDKILKERIDILVRLMKPSLPDFFNQYFAARKIVVTGVRHNNPTSGFDSSGFASAPTEPDDGN